VLTIGVLGGMGPAATADFFSRLVVAVGASHDQAHPEVIIYSAAHIPDRTRHLLEGGEDPTGALQDAARLLERSGAGVIAIPCNSAHAYLDAIRAVVTIPVLDMIDLTAVRIRDRFDAGTGVGVLAASATIRLGLYERRLQEHGLEFVPLAPTTQDGVMAAVRAIKGGHRGPDFRLEAAAAELVRQGAGALVLGCTEIPLSVRAEEQDVPVIDATEVLIDATLEAAGVPEGRR
jgi:aspartate racemase